LDKETFSVYKNLTYLYWQAGKTDKVFKTAQKSNKKPEITKQCWEKTLKLNPENETTIAYLTSYYSDNELKKSKMLLDIGLIGFFSKNQTMLWVIFNWE
jgi:hypothetical protein